MRPYQRIVEPSYRASSFNCPHCGALAEQFWADPIENDPEFGEYFPMTGYVFSRCRACRALALWSGTDYVNDEGDTWSDHRMVYPEGQSGPQAHPEMPRTVATLFNEASSILHQSPRASAALARMSLEELCKELGAKKKRLVDRIEELVISKKLDQDTQAVLTIVRCYGNDAVHNGGEILAVENSTDAAILLDLLNDLVERLIATPNRLAAMLARVPEAQRSKVIEHSDL